MANAPPNELNEILIVRITPQFLERGPLWFSKNNHQIKRTLGASPFWRDSVILLEKNFVIKPSEVLRRVVDFGYEKTAKIRGKGEFVWQGNLLEIWPINLVHPARIEFFGNTVEEILPSEREPLGPLPKIVRYSSLEKLPEGSFVVHIDHGIGIFRGKELMRTTRTEREQGEYYVVEYAPPRMGADPDRLLVPEDQAKRLSPYIGFDTPTVHRLGGTVWITARRKVKEVAEELAKELFELYKKRAEAKRGPYQADKLSCKEFDGAFLHEETADQKKATADIDHDLSSERPMDRIICGDVGFGKTEVAMRASFRALLAGKQVALISPTTILADQHLRNFTERFGGEGVNIAGLSRLTAKSEQKEIIKKIGAGKIDICIGTHRLLPRDVLFKNLGLVIVDEEQKFGVKQKERFKKMRSEVDILALSATPIPRTLSLALARLRDISLIRTPPPGRIPVKTFVLPYSTKIIREAVQNEQKSGGQVYFLHNRVETLGLFQKKLETLLPYTAIRRVHGRMPEQELIRTMRDFRENKFNVLLATTIIENGLDLPNVNTLIVEDAAKLGLAQAHQLRGRIGRGEKASYAYFLYRSRHLTEKALERLRALEDYSELGAGYDIALRDLEIRGAGNILGKEQSGAINKVGFNLYCQILNEVLEEMKGARHQ